jgi:hypothetical protein
MRRTRSVLSSVVVAAVTVATVVLVPASPAVAAAAKVQSSSVSSSSNGTLNVNLSAATTAGNLLVASLGYAGTNSGFIAPAGWVRGPTIASSNGGAEIWYLPSNPGGTTRVTFTYPPSVSAATGAVSEWSGMTSSSPLDQVGSATGSSTSSLTVTTASPTSSPGELAITAFTETFASNQNPSFTPGGGWTNIARTTGNGTTGSTTDYRIGIASGSTVTETQTSSRSGTWAGVIATFKVACSGGMLGLTAPAALTIPSVALNGRDQQVATSLALSTDDMTGSNAGWNVQATSTSFVNGNGRTLPTTAVEVTSASVSAAAGNCSLPSNQIAFPLTLPAGDNAPAPAKLFNALPGTGAGPANVALNFRVSVPANAYNGTYTSTWTFTIASGP